MAFEGCDVTVEGQYVGESSRSDISTNQLMPALAANPITSASTSGGLTLIVSKTVSRSTSTKTPSVGMGTLNSAAIRSERIARTSLT